MYVHIYGYYVRYCVHVRIEVILMSVRISILLCWTYPSLGRNFKVSLLLLRKLDQNPDGGRLTSLRLKMLYFCCGFTIHASIVTGVKAMAGAFGRRENFLCTNELKLLTALLRFFFCVWVYVFVYGGAKKNSSTSMWPMYVVACLNLAKQELVAADCAILVGKYICARQ